MNKSIFPLITEDESKLPFYVKSVGISENQEHMQRLDGYPDYHWLHCVKGKGKLLISGNEYVIAENMGFFFYPSVPHEYYAVCEPWETHWITFDGSSVPSLLDLLGFSMFGVFNISDIHKLERLLADISLSLESENSLRGFECSSILYRFLIELKNCITTGGTHLKSFRHNQLKPAISYIEKNYNKNFPLEELSKLINVTPQHFCRLFKQTFNMRPFTYLTSYRIQKAKELIVGSDCPTIKEVAKNIGFNDTSYFCAIFKEYEGITPIEFRRMHRSL